MDQSSVIGVVGAGTMGTGIAQVASTFGHQVYLYDSYSKQLRKSEDGLRKILFRQVEKQRMKRDEVQGILQRIQFVEDLTDFKQCDMAIEAVIENLDVKQDVLQRLEAIIQKDAVLATNTSSLSIALLSSVLKRPARFLGTHFLTRRRSCHW